jgi:hypothetical protein
LPFDMPNPPAATLPLYEYLGKDNALTYSTEPALKGAQRGEKAICRVWSAP